MKIDQQSYLFQANYMQVQWAFRSFRTAKTREASQIPARACRISQPWSRKNAVDEPSLLLGMTDTSLNSSLFTVGWKTGLSQSNGSHVERTQNWSRETRPGGYPFCCFPAKFSLFRLAATVQAASIEGIIIRLNAVGRFFERKFWESARALFVTNPSTAILLCP